MKRKLLFASFLLVFLNSVFAQQFPVSIIPRVNAPAPVNFYNYADETTLNSPITVQIFLNDLTISNRQIRLKTYFQGGNINFSSRDFVIGAQDLFLEGGIPLTLKNTELAPYYKLENIQGISSSVYGQTIPEGSYNFCFEVYDYISGAKLSAKKCAVVFIFKNEPPILNIPFTGTNIEPKDFENIMFQWTPRHINVTNVEYEFSIVEIWDKNVDPQTAFLSQAPIYEETTRRTSLIYGPDKPLLLSGRRYAWRVKAKALQGLEEIGLFKNQGYSEVFWFSRTASCQVPENISAEPKGTSKINVFWEQEPTIYSEYIIAYRESGKANANWFTKRTNSSWATIWDLKPGTTYEYKVKGKCTYQFSEYSDLQYVTTDLVQNEDANYNCGIVPDAIAISNRNPHTGLNVGDDITAGDFKVTITEIQSQSNGRLTGRGFVAIPYLKFAKFGVSFSNILINTENQLAEGEIVTLYDPEFGEGASMTVDVDVDVSEGINGDDGVKDDLVVVDFVIDSIHIDSNGAIVVTGTGGEEAIVPGDDDISIQGSNGDVWSVGEDGTITKEEGAEGGAVTEGNTNGVDNSGGVNAITAKGVTVVFEESGYYYYDTLPENTSETFEKEYKILETNGTKYKVPYKAISDTNGEDFIIAKVTISDADISKEDIIFKTKDGAKVEATWNANATEARLKLKRKFDYADEEIFAVVKSKEDPEKYDVAGSFISTHLASNQLEAINITLIPLGNNVTISNELKERTAEIYKKAGVRLNIQTGQSIVPDEVYGWDIDGNRRLKVGDSSILSHYTDEQLVFNNYIKQQSYYSDKTYYVFIGDIQISDANIAGFMPLKRQFGYVFTQNANTLEKQARTLAHELGHGVFGLEHTWDEFKFGQGATNFLMDYGNGTVLNHLDWKKMHAPGIQIYWFQGDEDGQYNDKEYISKVFQKIRCEYAAGRRTLDADFFSKEGSFSGSLQDYGDINVLLKKENVELGKITPKIEQKTAGGGNRQYTYKLYTLDFGGVIITAKWYNQLSKTDEKLEKLQNYLFQDDQNEIVEDYKEVLDRIVGKTEFTDEDIVEIKRIANCGAQYFTTENKYIIIKKIATHSFALTEYYEDLILDLINNFSGDIVEYSQEFLDYLNNDITLTKRLFDKIDDEHGGHFWKGNENNFTRFLETIFGLWKGTTYANPNNYDYIEVGDYIGGNITLSPSTIMYDGHSWFPNVSYENVRFRENKIFIETETRYGRHGKLKFDLFQPILVVFEKGKGKAKITKTEVPAIYFAGTTEKDNLEKSLDQIGLTIDIALTFTGVGNFAKLRHLTKLKQAGRIILGTVEITSGVVDILINYSDLCEGNEEFCKTIQEYNTYLQLGLLGSGLIQAKFKGARDKAKEAYEEHRNVLVSKYGENDPKIKELDNHFKVGKAIDEIEDKIKDYLTGTIKLTSDKLGVVKGYINTSDNYIDIIVHSDDAADNFSLIIELSGKAENITLTAKEFAQALKSVPNDKKIRLLSCNNSESAKEISKVLDREIIGSHGEMKIFSNNVVEADSWYVAKPNGKIDDVTINAGTPSGNFVVLKQKFVDNLDANIISDLKRLFGSQYDEFIDMVTRSKLPGTWSLKNIGGELKLVDGNGFEWATIKKDEIIAKAGGKGNGWNHLLNVDPPLMKGFTYKIDDKFTFETDQLGRVKKASLTDVQINPRKRNETAQSHAKNVKDGYSTDDGGHIFRAEWNGPSEQINYFPQAPSQNKPPGEWYAMEKFVSEFKKDNPTKRIDIDVFPDFSGSSKRPIGFEVEVKVDGELIKLPNNNQTYFPNPNI